TTASPESMALVKDWIQACHSLHKACTEFSSSVGGHAPTNFRLARLIDVSSKPARLQARGDLSSLDPRYLPLSHCWGEVPRVRLLKENLVKMQDAIPEEGLSLNIRQAFKITRNLGYRFIWIDSLCIIQDSRDDWLAESPKMTDVYGRSDCTIAAVGAHGDVSCFVERCSMARRPCKLFEEIYAHGYFARLEEVFKDTKTLVGLGTVPLLRRAWVVLERLLSPRIIYFGLQGLVWQCCSKNASEFWLDLKSRDAQPESDSLYSIKIQFATALRSTSRPRVGEEINKSWNSVVDAYTNANLTFKCDHSVALAGIASLVQRRTG
ncbi:uncharacterized protein A1O5_11465, partial [Cladophialophora psammophila CBS 110553]